MKLSKELLEKAKQAKTAEELLAIAKAENVELTEEEAAKAFAELNKTGEISDEELDNVAGGGCYSDGGRLKTTSGYKCKHYADGQSTYGIKGTCCRCKYWGVDPNAVCGSLWTTLIELIIKAAEAAEPRECYHPANSKKG